MGQIPDYAAAQIRSSLDDIKSFFKAPKATVLIRNPDIEDVPGSMDFLLTDDDLHAVLESIHRLALVDNGGKDGKPSLRQAYERLAEAMRHDPDYAWSWHCNVAMAAHDAGCDHRIANEGAARFMQIAFGVDIRECPQWGSLWPQQPHP